jgi:putative membrane-bound dehydrogenase-like protein
MRQTIFLSAVMAAGLAEAQIPQPTDAPKSLTPEQTAASYRLPPGFRLEVVACEPLIASPSGVCWDERGRMFVSELHGYNLEGQLDIEELNKSGQLDTQVRRVQADERFKKAAERGTYGVVKLLRDRDGDGRMDTADVWATNLPPAYGMVPARGGVIVACAPDIVFLADRDGDGRAEVREKLFTGFGTGALERGINAPQWGVDGWIYFGRGWGGGEISGPNLAQPVSLPNSDFRIRADGRAIEPVTGGTHTFGFAMTESGDRFVVSTTIPASYVAPLPWRYLVRNPNAATPATEAPTGDRRAYSISRPHPWRQKRADDPQYFKYYNSRYGAAESEAGGWFTAACGPMIYHDRVLPGLHGQYFVCEPAGNLIHRAVIESDGPVLKLRRERGEGKSEFAASRDAWSHPMNLTHGPDGAIWVVDYYREIIEDYSAIPRHLQQQYGVYAGHDRGRIYRLTHSATPRVPSADMGRLEPNALAREVGSSLFWRRQTAQRLLVERSDKSVTAQLRELLKAKDAEPAAAIFVLRTLEQLDSLRPGDLQLFLGHAETAVRVHALQLAENWLVREEGRELLAAVLNRASTERDPRLLIQLALSLGETRNPRAFALLTRFAHEHGDIRWMDAAVLSSVAGREGDLLAELLRAGEGSRTFFSVLGQAIGARGDDGEVGRVLKLLGYAKAETQAATLEGLVKGRRNAPRKPLADVSARFALTNFITNASTNVSRAALALGATFVPAVASDEEIRSTTVPAERVSEEIFREFVAALGRVRDLKRGHEIFLAACAPCHRVGNEGYDVGPDLLGQAGISEESLLRDLLLPNERIRPGYETTEARLRDGSVVVGLLKEDGATSLTIVQAGGIEQVLLRKDVAELGRSPVSLMPPFAEGLAPADAANVLAWLRSNLVGKPGK